MKKFVVLKFLILLFLVSGCGGTPVSSTVDSGLISGEPSVGIKYSKNVDNSYKFFAEIDNVTDLSSVSYNWDFGDNITETNISKEKEPIVNFKSTGVFDIGLTCTINGSEYKSSINVLIMYISQNTPEAKIEYVKNNDNSYTFSSVISGVSLSEVTEYVWDFGDNITGTGEIKGEKATVFFKSAGIFDAGLAYTVKNVKYYAVTKIIVEEIAVTPKAEIKYIKNSDNSYTFSSVISGVSSNEVTNYRWNFGDNITSSGEIKSETATVTFKNAGKFDVGLAYIVKNIEYYAGTQVIVEEAAVTPKAEIKYVKNSDNSYTFSSVIIGVSPSEVTEYVWDFGDNITTTGEIKGEKVTVSFKSTGKFDAGLTYTVKNVKYYAAAQIVVDKVNQGTVTINYENTGIERQYKFNVDLKGFEDTKNAAYSWDFGGDINEAGQNTILNPLVSYKTDGLKKVVLTVTISGIKYISNTAYIYINTPLVAGGGFTAGHLKTFMFAVNEGKLYGWGIIPGGNGDVVSSPKLISGIPEGELIISISAGEKHVLFLSESGKVYSLGRNEEGQLGNGDVNRINSIPEEVTGLSGKKIVKILAKVNVSYAVDENGVLYSWGSNGGGILGINSNESQSAIPQEVTYFTKNKIKVESISYGNNEVLVVGSDKNVYGWGQANDYGTNGHGANVEQREPKIIDKLKGINAVQAVTDVFSSFMVSGSGEVYSWGWNTFWELGETRTDVTIPDKIDVLSNIKEVVKARYAVFAIDNKNEVYSWGNGQLGRNGGAAPAKITGLTNVSKVYSTYDTGYAVTSDGALYGWGDDYYSQIGDNNPFGSVQTPKKITVFKDIYGQDIKTAVKVKQVIDLEGTTYLITEDNKLFSAGCNVDGETGTGKVSEYISYFTQVKFQ